jgi:hypothetical protein
VVRLDPFQRVHQDRYRWAPYSAGVVHAFRDLHWIALSPGAVAPNPVILNQNLPSQRDVSGNALSLSDTEILFQADPSGPNRDSLFVVDCRLPGQVTQLNPPLAATGNWPNLHVNNVAVTPDRTRIIGVGDPNAVDQMELLMFDPSNPGTQVVLYGNDAVSMHRWPQSIGLTYLNRLTNEVRFPAARRPAYLARRHNNEACWYSLDIVY